MEINEIGQLLFPLVGITRKQLIYRGVVIEEIGLKDNILTNFNVNKYALYVKYIENKPFSEYLKKNCKVLNEYEINNCTVTVLECIKYLKSDWRYIIQGNYSRVKRGTINEIIAPNLRENKSKWLEIFRRNKKDIANYVKKTLVNTKDHKKRTKIAHDTAEDIINYDINIELYKPLKRKNYVINR